MEDLTNQTRVFGRAYWVQNQMKDTRYFNGELQQGATIEEKMRRDYPYRRQYVSIMSSRGRRCSFLEDDMDGDQLEFQIETI